MNNDDLFIENRKIIFSIKPARTFISKFFKCLIYFFGLCEVLLLLGTMKNISEIWGFTLTFSILNIGLMYMFYYLIKNTEKIRIDIFDNGYMKAYASGFKYYIILLKNIAYLSPIRFKGQSSGYNFLDKNRNSLGFIQFAFFTSDQISTLIEYIKRYNPSLITEELKYFT